MVKISIKKDKKKTVKAKPRQKALVTTAATLHPQPTFDIPKKRFLKVIITAICRHKLPA